MTEQNVHQNSNKQTQSVVNDSSDNNDATDQNPSPLSEEASGRAVLPSATFKLAQKHTRPRHNET